MFQTILKGVSLRCSCFSRGFYFQRIPKSTSSRNFFSTGLVESSMSKSLWTKMRFLSNGNVNEISQPPKIVGAWLAACSFMVFGAIGFGGYVRLNNAGLSMVKWRLVKDMFPPTNEEEWLASYEEYKMSSDDITLEKYKKIYLLEYFHRMLGRATGIVFVVPAIIFFLMGKLKGLEIRVLIYNVLVLIQGLMGWLMVKSGLHEDTMSNHGEPGVSQYRLAAHFSLAMVLFALTTWQSLKLLLKPIEILPGFKPNITLPTAIMGHVAMLSVFLTSVYGAFVAGLDGGKICNYYPKMTEDSWVPNGLWEMSPGWKNLFENPSTVQLIHRILAHMAAIICTFAAIKTIALPNIPSRITASGFLVILCLLNQMRLGIQTVLEDGNEQRALEHQCGSIILLFFLLLLAVDVSNIRKGRLKMAHKH